jgi:pimeloyl-ACP methyl ester carboxylesterase
MKSALRMHSDSRQASNLPIDPIRWRRSAVTVADRVRVAVFEAPSPADTDSAPAILLLHGLGHWTDAAWSPIARRFAPTYRVIGIDLPGFGDSDRPDAVYDLAFFVRVVSEVIARLRLDRPAVAGHSLGALIAGGFAGEYPEQVRALALIAPAGFLRIPRPIVRLLGGPVAARLLRVRPSRRFVCGALAKAVLDPAAISDEVYERAFALSQDPLVGRAFARVYAGVMQELLDLAGLHTRLARYRGPAVIVWGRHDVYVPIRALATARRVYPQARVLVLERSAHCPQIEEPDLVAAELARAFAS